MFTRMLSTKTSITEDSFGCAHIVSHGRTALGKRRSARQPTNSAGSNGSPAVYWRSSHGPHQYGGRSSSRAVRLGAGFGAADGGGGVGCVVLGNAAPSLAEVTASGASAAWVSAVFGAAGAAGFPPPLLGV